jgi:reprolysin-like metallo-peptidase family M12B/Big-like domain-containing protein
MNKFIVTGMGLIVTLFLSVQVVAQKNANDFAANNWTMLSLSKQPPLTHQLTSKAKYSTSFELNISLLEQRLTTDETIIVSIPLPNGQFVKFKLTPALVMAPSLAQKYPSIRTFNGIQIDNSNHRGKFDIGPHGFHGLFSYQGEKVFIDPIYRDNNRQYHSYFKKYAQALTRTKLFSELSPREFYNTVKKPIKSVASKQVQHSLSTYRIAVSATAEYSRFHGGTKTLALAAIVTMINRLNDVFEQDLSLKLALVAQNDAIIFTDAATDPFDNTDNDIDVNDDVINNAIGINNYDLGHVVGTGGGGLAALGSVCSSYKAQGVTGSPVPTNDAFYIDFVAHELGHQFNANHTFNGTSGSCNDNRSASSAYEVGSASTIMGYAGICAEENLQNNSDPYFHIHSIDQIRSFVQSDLGCGSHVSKTNQIPSVNAGADFIIPARTAFTLLGQAGDAENDSLTYSWQEFDLGTASASKLAAQTDDGSRPLFRNFMPKNNAERTLPQLSDLVAEQSTFGETLPTTARNLNFRLVVRDSQNNLADDATIITVIASDSGFSIVEPSANAVWNSDQQVVVWNTTASELPPINCAQVDIWLSKDNGNNFAWLLLSKTPNDGSEVVNLPNLSTSMGRIKIACSDNIFFAFSPANISINANGSNFDSKPEFINQQPLSLDEDQSLTITKDDFVFVNNLQIDSVTVAAGNNYQVTQNTITPEQNFNGELMVAVTASKGEFTSDVFIASVAVIAVNDLPIALDDVVSVEQDSSNNSVNVLLNDSDIDNDVLTLTSINYSGAGSASISDNKINYSPATGFTGSDSVIYTLDDGSQGTSSATLTITVNAKTVVDSGNPTNNSGSSSGGSFWWSLLLWPVVLVRFYSKKAVV